MGCKKRYIIIVWGVLVAKIDAVIGPVAGLGACALSVLRKVGHVSIFIARVVRHTFSSKIYIGEVFKQVISMGFFSLPVVAMTAFFSGMVLALQTYTGFTKLIGESAVASIVVIAITRELGPVIAGLMVAGRMSSAFAAEIGTMCVSEQVDALWTMNVNPYKYLVVPRVLAGMLTMPFLVFVADIIGVFGGFIIGVNVLDFSPEEYLYQTALNLEYFDLFAGLIKAAFFGFAISLYGCYFGFNSKNGARGVGTATTSAVVSASILILIFNYVLTLLFFGI